MNIEINATNVEQAVKSINKVRLENKGKWYFIELKIENKTILIKGFNTWIQILKYQEWKSSSPMELKVNDFKEYLTNTINSVLEM